MKVTKQKINKLSERTGVSEAVATDALERADGDLLDAVILLEKEGKLSAEPLKNGTSYSSSSSVPTVYEENTDFIMKDPVSDTSGSDADMSSTSQNSTGKTTGTDSQASPKPEDFVGGPPPGGYYNQQNPGGNGANTFGGPPPGGYYNQQSAGPNNSYNQNASGGNYNSQSTYGYNYSSGGPANGGGAQNWSNGNNQQQQYYYDQRTGTYKYRDESTQFEDGAAKFGKALLSILRGTVVNHFEIWYKGGRLFHFPVLLFVLLFVPWIFWVSLITLVIGLACGWRYSFSGPHLGRKDGNE